MAVKAAVGERPVDFAVQPVENRRKRLLIADMDSTIINVECLDELADFAGVKDKVSEITERAMRGELAFEGALRERVGMLKGLSVDALQACYDDRVKLNPGARTLVRTMAEHGARCALVSGGFTFFTSRVAEAAGFHLNRANTLIEADGQLTGTVGEPILGKEAKLAALQEETAALGLTPADALAVGDGANDLAMIEAAGLGVAYRAKPIVAAQAHAKVDHADLTALLYFQGYTAGGVRRELPARRPLSARDPGRGVRHGRPAAGHRDGLPGGDDRGGPGVRHRLHGRDLPPRWWARPIRNAR
jgi:phosphoserine phosphatase